MQVDSQEDRYSRDRVRCIIGRVNLLGGLPPTEAYTEKLSTWFRTLATRGHTSAEFMSDPELVRETFEKSFPNPSTRSHFVQSFMKYLSGLSEEEYNTEYPNLERRQVVTLLQSVTRGASMEIRDRNKRVQ